jgi:hypothetical protein
MITRPPRSGPRIPARPGLAFAPQPWADQALCAEVDPELWFPEKGESARPAKQVCARCPVRRPCLDYALATGEPNGIWGGLTPPQRRALRRRQAAA